jgi:hypothetical protein
LGYNDAGELLPGQGGTNEMIAAKLFNELRSDGEEASKRLKVGWYVGKDQERVIHKKEVGRCCHSKLKCVILNRLLMNYLNVFVDVELIEDLGVSPECFLYI